MLGRTLAVASAVALTLAIAPAQAQTVYVAPAPVAPIEGPISALDARAIAEMHGVHRIDSIELNRVFNQWQVDGYDEANRYVEMDIDTNTGTILRLDR